MSVGCERVMRVTHVTVLEGINETTDRQTSIQTEKQKTHRQPTTRQAERETKTKNQKYIKKKKIKTNEQIKTCPSPLPSSPSFPPSSQAPLNAPSRRLVSYVIRKRTSNLEPDLNLARRPSRTLRKTPTFLRWARAVDGSLRLHYVGFTCL